MGTYQLVCLGNRTSPRMGELQGAVEAGVRNLGIDPAKYLANLELGDSIDWRQPVTGVWFATAEPAKKRDLQMLDELLGQGAGVLPVLEDLTQFRQLVPGPLLPLNGMEWTWGADRLASEVLRVFGLTRMQRSAFVSYRRTHSRDLAVQLFHTLGDRGYRAFLDTASVDFGAQFQDVLWDRLADIDLLIFVDTPGALSSTWINQELTRAHNLGMGILQLRWPGWEGFPGADLSFRFSLDPEDFEEPPTKEQQPNPDARLKSAALDLVMEFAEQARMRSLGSRRARIVGEIVRGAQREGLTSTVDPAGPVILRREDNEVGTVLPMIGLPDSEEIFRARGDLRQGGDRVRVAYDGLGVRKERGDYLAWLNQELQKYKTLPVADMTGWLKGL